MLLNLLVVGDDVWMRLDGLMKDVVALLLVVLCSTMDGATRERCKITWVFMLLCGLLCEPLIVLRSSKGVLGLMS